MTRRALVVTVLLGTVLLAAPAGAATGPPGPGPREVDLIASAQPSDLHPAVRDDGFAQAVVGAEEVVADVVAVASTACDGCTGSSVSLQVLHLTAAERAQADNVATAWTQDCWDCSATALSVQVLVLPGRPRSEPSNRSFAVTHACATCRAVSAAFQVVVIADEVTRLPPETLAQVRSWVAEQDAVLQAAVTDPAPAARSGRRAARAAGVALGELRRLATARSGARPWSARVQVSR